MVSGEIVVGVVNITFRLKAETTRRRLWTVDDSGCDWISAVHVLARVTDHLPKIRVNDLDIIVVFDFI